MNIQAAGMQTLKLNYSHTYSVEQNSCFEAHSLKKIVLFYGRRKFTSVLTLFRH